MTSGDQAFQTPDPTENPILRGFLALTGLLFLALGFVGILVPLVPGIPFLLIAAACFARSSERFHEWLLNLPVVGPPLRQWQTERTVPPEAKRSLIATLAVSFGLMILFLVKGFFARLLLAAVAFAAIFAVVRAPTRARIPLSRRTPADANWE